MYDIIKNKIYELFQMDSFSDIKDYIQNVIKNPTIVDSNKKILIRPIIKILFSAILKEVNQDITQFKNINSNIKCDNAMCDNNFCINEKINLDKFDGFLEQDILKLGILPIGREDLDEVSDLDIKTTRKIINQEYITKLVSIFSVTLKTLRDIDNLCKIKTNINNLNDSFQLYNIMNKIFNEMIFNKYRRHELFNYINKNISNEDLIINSDNEFLFIASEYTMSTLNQLYIKDLNKYYNTTLPFDKSIQRISSIQLETLKDTVVKNCKLNDQINEYEIDQFKCANQAIKNENKGITNSLHVYLSADEINDLTKLINSI